MNTSIKNNHNDISNHMDRRSFLKVTMLASVKVWVRERHKRLRSGATLGASRRP